MRSLKESLLADIEDTLNKGEDSIKEDIKQFLENNYKSNKTLKISKKPNKNGKYTIDCLGDIIIKNHNITKLTNNLFEFGVVKGIFNCLQCNSLTSLKGAPKKVGGYFDCSHCSSLASLDGAPKEVGGFFACNYCSSLTSLEGATEKVKGYFECAHCSSLTSLEGAPENVYGFNCSHCSSLTSLEGAPKKVGCNFLCYNCSSLTSLEGAPEEVGGSFYCSDCKIKFNAEDVKQVSKVKYKILC